MKKVIFALLLVGGMGGGNMVAGNSFIPSQSNSYENPQCPPTLVCVATNVSAKQSDGQGSERITISYIYKDGETYIAVIEGSKIAASKNSNGTLSVRYDNKVYTTSMTF